MGNQSKRKGAQYERTVADIWKEYFPKARRGIDQFSGNGSVADIENVPALHQECKHRENISPYKALEQAQNDVKKSKSNRIPCAVIRKNRKQDIILFNLNDFVKHFGKYLIEIQKSIGTAQRGDSEKP